MTTAIAKKPDLSELEKVDVSKLNVLAVYIGKEKGHFVASVLKIGEHLKEAKEILGTGGRSSQFGPWVDAECGFSIKTADRYIDAFSVFGKKKLDTVSNFEPSALYLLAADSTPEDATKEALKLADKGQPITKAVAQEIIAKHNGTPGKPAKPTPPKVNNPKPVEPDPEPTAEEEEVKPVKPAPPSETFDDNLIETLIGKLARAIDDRYRIMGSKSHRDACHSDINEFITDWKGWKKQPKGAK